MLISQSVAGIEGLWADPPDGTMTGLIQRCKQHWNVAANQLPDFMIATYLRQQIAATLMIEEATRRLLAGTPDDTELYEGQLAEALNSARMRH